MNAFHNAAKSYKKSNPEGMFFYFAELQLRTNRFYSSVN